MKEKKSSNKKLLFTKKNYLISGESYDPNIFNKGIYNFRRIRIAPLLVLVGLGMQVYAILFSSKK